MYTCFLPHGRIYSGEDEAIFFEENTPIGAAEVYEVLAAVYHGIVPAFAEADLGLLRAALWDVQQTGFKKREIAGQTGRVRELLELLHSRWKLAAGMSSLGPLVYGISLCDRSVPGSDIASAVGGVE